MTNSVIIIPSRLSAKRLLNKPLMEIKGIPMIVHVVNRAKESKVGDVYVATPDAAIVEIVKKHGNEAILTSNNHETGTDRIYEVYSKKINKKIDIIINLQGDMPNIKPESISKLNNFMRKYNCDMGTLAANCKDEKEMLDINIVKVSVDEKLNEKNFLQVKDFFRLAEGLKKEKVYHHIGCYAYTSSALTRYAKLSRTKKEIERNLEQMRAIENNFIIKVCLSNSLPLGVDTKRDFLQISREMV